jgi:hypothetical protein
MKGSVETGEMFDDVTAVDTAKVADIVTVGDTATASDIDQEFDMGMKCTRRADVNVGGMGCPRRDLNHNHLRQSSEATE